MNTHQASELVAADLIREHASNTAAGYTENPQDLAAARLALLMVAAQREAAAQGRMSRVVFENDGGEE